MCSRTYHWTSYVSFTGISALRIAVGLWDVSLPLFCECSWLHTQNCATCHLSLPIPRMRAGGTVKINRVRKQDWKMHSIMENTQAYQQLSFKASHWTGPVFPVRCFPTPKPEAAAHVTATYVRVVPPSCSIRGTCYPD